ncbi:hypothetical protein CSHISOI_10510, partial [Colletotrichum shisoi]
MDDQAAQAARMFSHALNNVTPHPLSQQQLDDNQSDLSSALTDAREYGDLWELCDKILDLYNPTSPSDNTCTVLQTFRQILSKHGQIALMADIKTIGRDQAKLRLFARHLNDTICKPFKVAGNIKIPPTPSPIPDAAAAVAQSAAQITPSTRDNRGTLKKDCLRRDGFRCAYSHYVDRDSALDGLVVPPVGVPVAATHLSHILPLALRKFDDAKPAEKEAIALIWYSLHRYFPALNGKIGPGSLNQHQNLITFDISAHQTYDAFILAFNPLPEKPNSYEIKQFQTWPIGPSPPQGHREVMTLVARVPDIPLPDPEFFRVHYQVSKILD